MSCGECCQVMYRRGGIHIIEELGVVIEYLIAQPANPPPAEACCDVDAMRSELWAGLCETRRIGYRELDEVA